MTTPDTQATRSEIFNDDYGEYLDGTTRGLVVSQFDGKDAFCISFFAVPFRTGAGAGSTDVELNTFRA